jgi:hypothetical protein
MNNLKNLPKFYIGQKIVCINDSNQNNETIIKILNKVKEKEVYTVRGFSLIGGILLKEFIHGFHYTNHEAGFHEDRFNVVQESKFPSLTWSKVLEKESQLISMN